MDPRTLDLLRALQAEEHTAAALDHICQEFREQRAALAKVDDRATLNELCELLEAWADGATADLASMALHEAALSIEEDLEQPLRAIAVLERVLDLEPTTDSLAQLARLYTQRNGEGDRVQAAELYSALGETLGDEGRPWLERALNLVPTHDAALEALETIVPEGERPAALRERWAAYLENGGDSKAEAEGRPDAAKSGERRRLELSRAYAAEGSFRDALVFIAPLAERGHSEAARLQEAYLANLEGAVAPVARGKKADSLPPPKHARPARSGGTMVGFRLDQYHEALRQEIEEERGSSEPEPEPDNQSGVTAKVEHQRAEPKPAMLKTQLGLGAPTQRPAIESAAKSAPASKVSSAPSAPSASSASKAPSASSASSASKAPSAPSASKAPSAADGPSEDSVVRAMPRSGEAASESAKAASQAVTSNGDSAPSGSAADEAPAVRRSLPPPNPEVVRASQPAPARRSASGQGMAASVATSPSPRPQPQLHLAAMSAPMAKAAPFVAPAASLPMAASLPTAATEMALPQVAAEPQAVPSFALPAVAPAAALDDEFATRKPKASQRAMWPFAVGGAVVLAIGVYAMMGGKKTADSTRVSQVSAEAATASAAAPAPSAPAAPPPSAATTTTTVGVAAAATAAVPTIAPAPTTPEPAKVEEPKKVEPEKALGTVKAAAKDIRVKGGKITGTKVLASFEASLTKIEHCYEEALEDNPKTSGRATLGFTIGKNGQLSGAKLSKSTLKNAKLERCTLAAVKSERFAKLKKPAQVTMPLAFSR